MGWKTTVAGWATYPESPYRRGSNPYNTSSGSSASSAAYNGVTWTFDTNYTVGQFIDGSWWVVDPGAGVTVNSVSPAPSAGVNGSMINPVSGGNQGFHSGADSYNAGVSVSFPQTLSAGDALLSSVEYDGTDDNTEWDNSTISSSSTHYFVKEVGVLTVLAEAPPADAFRPGYCDRTQTIYTVSQIVSDNIPTISPTAAGYELAFTSGGTYQIRPGDTITGATSSATATVKRIALTSGTWAGGDAAGRIIFTTQTGTFQSENLNVGANSNVATIAADSTALNITAPSDRGFASAAAYFARGSERPWMLFCNNFAGRETHPTKHMNNYHRDVGTFLSELCSFVCMDYENKDDAVNGLIQIGIDMYYCGLNGAADSSFWTTPIIMAGHFLNDAAMKNCFINGTIGFNAATQGIPRDFADFYFYEDRNDTTTSAIVTAGQNYMNAAVDGRYVFCRNNLAANRGYEHLDPSEWGDTASGATTANTDRGYRIGQDSHPHVGMAVAAGICDLWDEWAHPATQAYIERWMQVEDFVAEQALVGSGAVGQATSESDFVDSLYEAMWVQYEAPA